MRTCPLSRFKTVFGAPGEGLHAPKFEGTSCVDYALTVGLAALVTRLTGWPLVLTTVGAFAAGVVAHTLCGVPTRAVVALGLACQ